MYLRSDNGPEFVSQVLHKRLKKSGAGTLYIAPGSPRENGYIELFGSKLRDELLKREFHGTKMTSDAGLLAYRELDEALGLTAMIESQFCDNRKGRNIQHNLIALLRQPIYGRLAGYEDTNDAERLSVDPAMRQIVGGRAKENKKFVLFF